MGRAQRSFLNRHRGLGARWAVQGHICDLEAIAGTYCTYNGNQYSPARKMTTTMKQCLFALLLVVAGSWPAHAQLHPAEGDSLTSIIVAFREIAGATNNKTRLEVATGYYTDAAEFERNVTITTSFTGNKTIADMPGFAKDYTWRMTTGKKPGALHHFTVAYTEYIDSTKWRLRVAQRTSTYKDGYVFVDGYGTLFDMQGHPVWFSPLLLSEKIPSNLYRDIKMTPAHTITLLYKDHPMEIDWRGRLLWTGTSNGVLSHDATENYHHDFTRLPNGHHIVLGGEKLLWPYSQPPAEMKFGTVLEYDQPGHICWYWKSSDLYFRTDYVYNGRAPHTQYDVHENAFALDTTRGVLWVSFKNVSQIVKVKYPQGKLMGVFGKRYDPGYEGTPSLFYEQHALNIARNGALYLLDNHNPDNSVRNFKPRILVVKEQAGELVPEWEFTYESKNNTSVVPDMVLSSGGNVQELPDGSFFTAMCGPYANLFIVNRQKTITWEAVPEKYYTVNNTWRPTSQYRASIVLSRKELEQMVWRALDRK
ncbi:MAG: hypothetical protein EBZ77_08315 [Chitinophagia bacterium]|nr:hypothetical protein [Chitinophagia bacterium]